MEEKIIYNEEIEKQITQILFNHAIENKIPQLLKLYQETKYPGILANIADCYRYGYYECFQEENEEKALEYYHQAAKEGYGPSFNEMGDYYLNQVKELMYQAKQWYNKGKEVNPYGKYQYGVCCVMESLLKDPRNSFDVYFEGLKNIEDASSGYTKAYSALQMLEKNPEFDELKSK